MFANTEVDKSIRTLAILAHKHYRYFKLFELCETKLYNNSIFPHFKTLNRFVNAALTVNDLTTK